MPSPELNRRPVRRDFSTLFDRRYLARGLALLDSLRTHCAAFRLFVVCLDAETEAALGALAAPELVLVPLARMEQDDPAFGATRPDRTLAEYYFTCCGCLPAYLLGRFDDIDLLTYVDADTYLFSDPEPVFHELEGKAVGITEHRYAKLANRRLRNGRFNVGWVSIRRDAHGQACAAWWRERCIEWCYDRIEANRFGDQKYLDEWPARFAGVHVITHPGVNVAPWNVGRYRLTLSGGTVLVDDVPLVLYHFASLRRVRRWLYDSSLGHYLTAPSRVLRRHVYRPYIRNVERHEATNVRMGTARRASSSTTTMRGRLRAMGRTLLGLAYRQYLIVPGEPST